MNLFISKIISSIIQIVLFTLVPLVWWLITARKKCNFFEWIGLKKVDEENVNKTIWGMAGVLVSFIVLSVFMLTAIKGVDTATSDFAGLGFKAIPAILVYAILNTALPEEIIFRGFLLKRIQNKFGFIAANTIQAVIFGLMHGVFFFAAIGPVKAVLIILFTGMIGWFMGFLNEKSANGSILPSWGVHALANIFSGICSAFSIL